MNILLIEDNRIISKGITYALEQNGYSVTLCESFSSALCTAPFDFDLIIIDISLPDGNGFELFDEIHRLSRAVEEILYPSMEDFAIDIITGKGQMAASYHLPLPKFTLVGATTRAGQLTAPLRDRFGVVLRLELYTPEELAQIVTRSAGN